MTVETDEIQEVPQVEFAKPEKPDSEASQQTEQEANATDAESTKHTIYVEEDPTEGTTVSGSLFSFCTALNNQTNDFIQMLSSTAVAHGHAHLAGGLTRYEKAGLLSVLHSQWPFLTAIKRRFIHSQNNFFVKATKLKDLKDTEYYTYAKNYKDANGKPRAFEFFKRAHYPATMNTNRLIWTKSMQIQITKHIMDNLEVFMQDMPPSIQGFSVVDDCMNFMLRHTTRLSVEDGLSSEKKGELREPDQVIRHMKLFNVTNFLIWTMALRMQGGGHAYVTEAMDEMPPDFFQKTREQIQKEDRLYSWIQGDFEKELYHFARIAPMALDLHVSLMHLSSVGRTRHSLLQSAGTLRLIEEMPDYKTLEDPNSTDEAQEKKNEEVADVGSSSSSSSSCPPDLVQPPSK